MQSKANINDDHLDQVDKSDKTTDKTLPGFHLT